MRYSVCVDMLFSNEEFGKRLEFAKMCDIQAIEFWKWSNKNIDAISEKIKKTGLGAPSVRKVPQGGSCI